MAEFLVFLNGNLTDEEGLGKLPAKLLGQTSVIGEDSALQVTENGAGADDSVDVAAGTTVILDGEFAYIGWADATVNVPVSSNSSGNPRIDTVVAYADTAVVDALNNNAPDGLVLAVVEGTPAGSPSAPNDATIQSAVGANNPFMRLANIAVANGFSSITNANITDLRVWPEVKLQELVTDVISERVAGAGVTVDSLSIKDGQVNASGGEAMLRNIQIYTSNDTWTKPTGLKFAIVKARGGGSGGGGVGTTSGTGSGGGGGQGGFSMSKIAAASLGSTEAVGIGAGGAGGIGNNSGAAGSDTTFGTTLVVAKGADAGGAGSAGNVGGRAGGGNTVLGTGDFTIYGESGHGSNALATTLISGSGGGEGGFRGRGSAGNGGDGVLGGGGAGGYDTGTTSRNGGAGGKGWVIVEEYF